MSRLKQHKCCVKESFCFLGCLVVSIPGCVAVLASLGGCASSGSSLVVPDFPSSCARLSNVSLCVFNYEETVLAMSKCSSNKNPPFSTERIDLIWFVVQRISGSRRDRGHGPVLQLYRRSCWFSRPLAAGRKTHLPDSLITGLKHLYCF